MKQAVYNPDRYLWQSFVNMIAAESAVKKHHAVMTVVRLLQEKQ